MIRRLLMTADTVGGVWNYSLDLAKGLCARGAEVVIAAMGRRPSHDQMVQAASIPGLTVEAVEAVEFKLEWMDDPWNDVESSAQWLLGLDRSFEPDVVHLNGFCHASLPWSGPTLVTVHSCVLSWWNAVRGAKVPVEWSRYESEVQKGLRAAKMVVAPTLEMMRKTEELYGCLPRTRVVPNGADATRYRPRQKEAFVFSAGRFWDEAKNLRALGLAAPKLNWPLYLAGEDPSDDELQNVTRLGVLAQPEMASWMGRASIYALPAKYEPFGLSVLEAAMSGCALVLGDIPTLRENWDGCARFVDPNCPQTLADTINELAQEQLLRNNLAALAFERSRQFGLDTLVDRYGAIYEDLVRKFPPTNSAPELRSR